MLASSPVAALLSRRACTSPRWWWSDRSLSSGARFMLYTSFVLLLSRMVFLHRRRAALFGERAPNIWAILFAGYPRRALRSTKTGQWACRTTNSETLPIRARSTPPTPRLPSTISPAPSPRLGRQSLRRSLRTLDGLVLRCPQQLLPAVLGHRVASVPSPL